MIPTPCTSHVFFDTIYEPAEDSYLLLDAISSPSEVSWLHERFARTAPPSPSPLITEIGVGSGVLVAFLVAHAKTILGREDVIALGVDVNPNACAATVETVSRARDEQRSLVVYLGSVCGDLTSSIIAGCIDLVIFNPPYVPTQEIPLLPDGSVRGGGSSFEAASHLLSLSYAGGLDGMNTTYRLLKSLPAVLSDRGVAYVLLCARNKPEVVKSFVKSALMMRVETVGSSGKAAGWEKLEVIRIWR